MKYRKKFAVKENVVLNVKEIVEVAVVDWDPVIWHVTVGLM